MAIEDEAGLAGWWLFPAQAVLSLDPEDRGLVAALIALSGASAALWSVRMSREDPGASKYRWPDAGSAELARMAVLS